MTDDWRTGKTVLECNRYMLENELHCDVVFIVGTGENKQPIQAHKFILIARSEVFEAMLIGPLHEHSNHIDIPDASPEAFRKLLQYMYYDHTKIEEQDAYELLYVARKYLVTGLVKRCLQRLKTKMSVENVCLILSYADDDGTVGLCLSYIFRYPSEVLKSDGFKELSTEHVKTIVASNRLSMREEDVFEAVIAWSERECQRQNVDVIPENQYIILKDILEFIRFGRMDKMYLLNVCKKFLPQEHYMEIIEKLAELNTLEQRSSVTSEENTLASLQHRGAHPPFASCGTETRVKERSLKHIPMEVLDGEAEMDSETEAKRLERVVPPAFSVRKDRFDLYRFDKHSFAAGKPYDMQSPESISFIMSRVVDLVGILIYGSCRVEGDYQIHLEIVEDIGGHLSLIHSSERELHTDGVRVQYCLDLPPISLTADKVYTISALIRGPPSYFGTNGKQSVIRNGVSVDFITNDEFDLNLTTSEGGQFPGLVFEKPV